MVNDTFISVVGNIVGEVRSGTTADGVPSARFRVAVSRRWQDRESGEWRSGPASFYGVSCYRRLAENVCNMLERGAPVLVSGRLSVREWERDGRWRTTAEIDAQAVGRNLAWKSADLAPSGEVIALPLREEVVGGGQREVPVESDAA